VQLLRTTGFAAILWTAAIGSAQQGTAPAPAQPPTVIKTETKLVLVDVVVANKKGQYVEDLALKDFRVWEDNKEQQLKTFSFGPDPSGPDSGKRYIVLFFDSMTLTPTELIQARLAAQKFIESNAGADRLVAVASYMGSVQITQNFTPDIDKLKLALGKVRATGVLRGPEVAIMGNERNPRVDQAEEFAARTMLQGMRGLAKNLGEIPGRKSLILFTSGFPLSTAGRDEATVTISVCNRSNVAIYPVDARGISGSFGSPSIGTRGRAAMEFPGPAHVKGVALAAWPVTRIASFFLEPQGRGAGGGTPPAGGGGGAPAGGGATGGNPASGGGNPASGGGNPGGGIGNTGGGNSGRGAGLPGNDGFNNGNNGNNNGRGGGGNDPFNNNNNPFDRNNNNNGRGGRGGPFGMELPSGALDRQQILYMLADGTGGFVILNTNDLAGGLEKIAKEQNAYYILGYTPVETPEGSCHTLKVKVDRGGTTVRSRAGYCNSRSRDVLAGNPIEKTLESRVTGTAKGNIEAAMSVPHFYTGANTARVAVTLEIPTEAVKFEKVKGKQHAAINILGIAYGQNGSVAARFSDVVKMDYENGKEVEKFKSTPLHYENQFDIAAGIYAFKVVFDSGGENFGKLEAPLTINAYDPTMFAISGVALCKSFGPAAAADTSIDSLLLEGRSPLIAGMFKFNPSGYSRFSKKDNVGMYFEIYDPLLSGETPPKVSIQMRFLDAKTGTPVTETGSLPVDNFVQAGNTKVATGLKLPVATLAPGVYRLEIKALDSAGTWAMRTADFEVMQ
jgi:VWFA-related protein